MADEPTKPPSGFSGWWQQNNSLFIFMMAQAVTIASAGAWLVAYYVQMETRVAILETRGAPFTVDKLTTIEHEITVLQQKTDKNSSSIERIVEIMLRDRSPSGGK